MKFGKWATYRELGRGGQGTAYLALNTEALNPDALVAEIRTILLQLHQVHVPEANQKAAFRLLQLVEAYLGRESDAHSGALKVLHDTARSDTKALQRLRAEVEVLTSVNHPALIPILDSTPQEGWYATPFYRRGTLASSIGEIAGNPYRALELFRPLVEGVAELHKRGVVHRNIKPENIFMSKHGLILGDFGIV